MSRYLKGSVVSGKSARSGPAVVAMAVSASMPRACESFLASSAFSRCCPWSAAAMYIVSFVPIAVPRSSYERPLASRACRIFWSAAALSMACLLSACRNELVRADPAVRQGLLLEVPGALDDEMNDVATQARVLGLVDDVRPGPGAGQLDLD